MVVMKMTSLRVVVKKVTWSRRKPKMRKRRVTRTRIPRMER